MYVKALCRARIGAAAPLALEELFFGYKGLQAGFKEL
jgi:hypothetical protein